ncbi:hypothetical protein [Bdellovibrio sp. HCB209]|uniref:hypothetical protein n=1 Tax=Bdellovibrio sp. HCB209 TaxID=3394354 RepID=UPI0039B4A7E1
MKTSSKQIRKQELKMHRQDLCSLIMRKIRRVSIALLTLGRPQAKLKQTLKSCVYRKTNFVALMAVGILSELHDRQMHLGAFRETNFYRKLNPHQDLIRVYFPQYSDGEILKELIALNEVQNG